MKLSILMDIRESQAEIIQAREKIESLRQSLYGRAIPIVGKVQRSPQDVMTGRIADIVDKEAKISRKQRRLDRRKAGMRRYLCRLENEDHAKVLDLYYLSLNNGRLNSWADVAKAMNHPEGYVKNKMRYAALDKLNDILRKY